jgi:hypothetical protein
VDNGTGLPPEYPHTYTLGTAAPGNERLFPYGFQGADILKLKFLPIALVVELGTCQAPGYPFPALLRVGIERTGKSCSPAGIDISLYLRDVTGVVAERDRKIPKEPGGLQLTDAGRETRAGRCYVIDMDPEQP